MGPDSKTKTHASLRAARLALLLLVLVLGALSVAGEGAATWMGIAVILHAVPVLAQMSSVALIRVYGLWLAAALVLHFLISVFLLPEPAPRLPIHLAARIEYRGDVMPGLSGIHTITTDAVGFRTTRPVNYHAKPADIVRIVAIGGSTTEQIDVDDRKTWAHLLQERLTAAVHRDVELINTGVSGLRMRHHLATLRRIEPLAPDIVILMAGINDWNHHIRMADSPVAAASSELIERARFSASLTGRALIGLRHALARSPATSTDGANTPVRVQEGEYFAKQNDSLNRAVKKVRGIEKVSENHARQVGRFAERCRSSGARCVFVTQANGYRPDVHTELKRRFWMTPPNEPYTLSLDEMQGIAGVYNDFLARSAAANGFTVCDIARAIPPTTDYFFDDCHFNERGSVRVAELLSDCIMKANLIPRARGGG